VVLSALIEFDAGCICSFHPYIAYCVIPTGF
jgi:hypothetical protein